MELTWMRPLSPQLRFIDSKFKLKTRNFYQSLTFFPLIRLLNAYAEEAATEDAIYYLGEALRGGVIDLEVFLKHIRQLSRKQFMLRAIMQKCRQKAGLAG